MKETPNNSWQKWGCYKVFLHPDWYFVLWPPAQHKVRNFTIHRADFTLLDIGESIKKPSGGVSLSLVKRFRGKYLAKGTYKPPNINQKPRRPKK